VSCGRRLSAIRRTAPVAALAAIAIAMLAPAAAVGQTLTVVARLTPEAGRIVDAAMISDTHLALLYPDAGQIADYTLDGKLYQHILREGGRELAFRPTACCAREREGLLVFDEAAHKLFTIAGDGNFERGIDLAYPQESGGPLALAAVGDIALGPEGVIDAMLPDRGVLASFDGDGKLTTRLNLLSALPYPQAVYARAQPLADGSLFVLDYNQGAVIYRRGAAGQFRRLTLEHPAGIDAAPLLQDFAVDEGGNVLLATADPAAPLVLLRPGKKGYTSHHVKIELPRAPQRFSTRYSRGRFILWLRETPSVIVLELR